MFTGIVEEIGEVVEAKRSEGLLTLTTRGKCAHEGAQLGDSIAVNGVCLTVVRIVDDALTFEAVPETLRKTNLGALKAGDGVNLERALSAGRPMGGHYVQGHVDATATLRSSVADGEALDLRFELDPQWMRFVVPKGFITVDGASLTVVDVFDDGFSVTLVPHTQKVVVFGDVESGYNVNIEVDVFAKYVDQAVQNRLSALEARLAALEP